jgi:hypothetical protein
MKGVTWARDSHGLFDYESRNITKKQMKTMNSCKLIRMGNDLELTSLLSKASEFGAEAKSIMML